MFNALAAARLWEEERGDGWTSQEGETAGRWWSAEVDPAATNIHQNAAPI